MSDEVMLTLDELAEQIGMSIRTIRFYTSRSLVPPPVRQGRQGFYGPDHVARLELVRELQERGFTLAAIEAYVANPAAAAPSGLADLGLSPDTARRAAEIFQKHGRAIADELAELFETEVVPAHERSGRSREELGDLVEKLKPLSLAALISAYEAALAEGRPL